jgi:hypothetical protein
VAEVTPHWDQNDWGNLTLGSNTLPGKWEVEGEASRKVDIKERKDQDGAVIKDQGYSNAEITLVGRIFNKDQFDKLQKALKEIHPRRKGAARDPLAVVHPALDTIGVSLVYVLAIEAPKLGDDGIVEVRIRCLEWIPKPKDTVKKKAAPISPASQRIANASVTKGREILLDNGQTKYDLGIPPPRDSALAFLEPNRIAP